MKRLQILIVLLVLIAEFSCKKIVYFPDKSIVIEETKLIAHRGGRSAVFRENTLEGIKAALRQTDGIEVDVQISKSENIWLSHSEDLMGCNKKLGCFPESTDSEIKAITTCNGIDISYTDLESVFSFIKDSFPKAVICIDLKAWNPCSGNSLDIEGVMRREALIIVKLSEKYSLIENTFIETETSSVLLFINEINPTVKMYLTVFGDFERGMLLCLNYGFDGMSFKTNVGEAIDKEKMDLLHRKGLRLIAWNLRNQSEAIALKSYGVDFVQIDL